MIVGQHLPKVHQIRSQSTKSSKISWGGMPPDPPRRELAALADSYFHPQAFFLDETLLTLAIQIAVCCAVTLAMALCLS